MLLIDSLDADEFIAVRATWRFLRPALERRVHRIVRAADPDSCFCERDALCAECAGIVNEILVDRHRILWEAARGRLPRTAGKDGQPGEEIREWRLLVEALGDPDGAGGLDADEAGMMLAAFDSRSTSVGGRSGRRPGGPARAGLEAAAELARRPAAGAAAAEPAPSEPARPEQAWLEQAWLRAAWAQLVYYPTRNLKIELRRAAAVRRGMPARPMRSISNSSAAGPLAADPAADSALRELVNGLWARVSDPYHLPKTMERHALTSAEAQAALDRGLALLRAHDPELLHELVTGPLADRAWEAGGAAVASPPTVGVPADTDPTWGDPAVAQARSAILAAVEAETGGQRAGRLHLRPSRRSAPSAPGQGAAAGSAGGSRCPARRRSARRPVTIRLLHVLLQVADGCPVDPVARCRTLLGVDEPTAREEVRRLAALVAAAGAAWVDELVSRHSASPTAS